MRKATVGIFQQTKESAGYDNWLGSVAVLELWKITGSTTDCTTKITI